MLEREVFPTRAAGEYFNGSYVFLRSDMSVEHELAQSYKVSSAPTYLFFNAEGENVMRLVGSQYTLPGLKKEIEEGFDEANTIKERERRFAVEPSYACEYVNYLMYTSREHDKAQATLELLFASRTAGSLFTSEWMSLYNTQPEYFISYVFPYMLEHRRAVSKVMGKAEYQYFVKIIANLHLSQVLRVTTDEAGFDKMVEEHKLLLKRYPFIETGYQNFLIDNIELIAASNTEDANIEEVVSKLITAIEDVIFDCGALTRKDLLVLLRQCQLMDLSNERAYNLYVKVIDSIEDSRERERASFEIEKLKMYMSAMREYLLERENESNE